MLAAIAVALVLAGSVIALDAQTRRVASPPAVAATEVLGRHDEREGYVNGRWLEIRYGAPIKRGRDLFGPPDFADALADGAPVWRAGANHTTRLVTEVALVIGGKTVPAGEHTLFIDITGPDRWTLIVSNWPAQLTYDESNKAALWGAYEYTPDRDVVRAPMKMESLTHSFDQLTWQFLDMSDAGGRLALLWDRKLASVPFEIVR
ncbi:MAG: DUF2911 domain-containing protein [Vicinamibacterales bacterium]